MYPERFAAFVAVKERRKDPERQRRCDEERLRSSAATIVSPSSRASALVSVICRFF